mmetsp:Transcript_54650/g.98121  ORF Transcript_54650/g.98121 Transcript_54650/m.98121 type:complete len:541 (+) Transcript_54650:58-1680(+)
MNTPHQWVFLFQVWLVTLLIHQVTARNFKSVFLSSGDFYGEEFSLIQVRASWDKANVSTPKSLQLTNASVVPLTIKAKTVKESAVEERRPVEKKSKGNVYYAQELMNFGDVQYAGNITVGGQELLAVLDTGSFENLVFSADCMGCGDTTVLYRHEDHSSYQMDEWKSTHAFGSGSAESQLASDDFQIGPLEAKDQYFWEVTSANMPVIEQGNFQAIIGVGPSGSAQLELEAEALTANATVKSFQEAKMTVPSYTLKAAVSSNKFAEAMATKEPLLDHLNCTIFSYCLQRKKGSPGWFYWNDNDPVHKPELFQEVPVQGEVTWGVKMAKARLEYIMPPVINGTEVNVTMDPIRLGCDPSCGAIVDTGTSLFAVPPDVYERAHKALKDIGNDCKKISQLPELKFQLGDHEYTLPPHSYAGQVAGLLKPQLKRFFPWISNDINQCHLLLMQVNTKTQFGPMWIIGMPFFREYYTTFHLSSPTRNTSDTNHTRSIFTARAGENCTAAPPALRSELMEEVRMMDLARLSIPHWVQELQEDGYHHA